MFSKEEFDAFFSDLSKLYAESVQHYTDLLNELEDKLMKSKLLAMAGDDMDAFDFLQSIGERKN